MEDITEYHNEIKNIEKKIIEELINIKKETLTYKRILVCVFYIEKIKLLLDNYDKNNDTESINIIKNEMSKLSEITKEYTSK